MSRTRAHVALVSLVLAVASASPISDSVVHRVSEQDGGSRRDEHLVASPCLTSDGVEGLCASLSQCYSNFKLLSFTNNTCSYSTPFGSKLFGVCCANVGSDQATLAGPGMSVKIPGRETRSPHLLESAIFQQLLDQVAYPTSSPITQSSTQPPTQLPTSTETWPPEHIKLSDLTFADLIAGTYCGYQDERRIINGESTAIGEWPWMVALFLDGRQFCGGSLITNQYILTAAHCVAQLTEGDWKRITVRLGDHNMATDLEVQHVERTVEKIVTHASFNKFPSFAVLLNDITLLKMDSPVNFTKSINPICLPIFRHDDYTGESATAIGWGLFKLGDLQLQPAILQKVNLPIWSNHKCQIKYGDVGEVGMSYQYLCAGEAGRDTCKGDSGGPLMLQLDGRWTQIGITSWGYECGKLEYPGVYTRVTTYTAWITKHLFS